MNIRMRCLAAIAASILMATHTVVAAETAAIVGPGTFSCGKFMAMEEGAAKSYFFFWAQGYLTGLNTHFLGELTPDFTDLADIDGQILWLENFCRENPLDLYYVAVSKLWVALREQQGLEKDSRFEPED